MQQGEYGHPGRQKKHGLPLKPRGPLRRPMAQLPASVWRILRTSAVVE